jgi:uncharacterized protein (TIGR00251 family)
MQLSIKVVPNAKVEKIVPEGAGYKVYLCAPAVDGKANARLVEFLADHCHVRKSAVSIVRGLTSRRKVVEIAGIEVLPLRCQRG